MAAAKRIEVYDRRAGRVVREPVWGEGLIRLLYGTGAGRLLTARLFSRRALSRLYGWLQSRPLSRGKIRRIADRLSIDLSEAQVPEGGFRTFNEFFTRALKREARPIERSPDRIVAPCDARLLARESLDPGEPVDVKGCRVDLASLLGGAELARLYAGGTMFAYRLCPADYHRFHFPEDCTPGFSIRLGRGLHSVNPIALACGLRILDANARDRTMLETRNGAGRVAMVEIGALFVGSVEQTFVPRVPSLRGDEKGMFRIGGSTVLVLYEMGKAAPDEDIQGFSGRGIETVVKLGTPVGKRI